ncbi:hypothetical protein K458DRAFT_29295 [Lentithecium fluviatile CBS 122367]|uniref:Uncharacterized protein n=1 Tax=Lentithecium fluviatile CBS 122367 TaxID=1168545 RepID=A0A6G1J3J4_9PLEO|nr:hypothetical protein K458DRAFT_29295 [Lentithecium fluviatile CBS 122367]
MERRNRLPLYPTTPSRTCRSCDTRHWASAALNLALAHPDSSSANFISIFSCRRRGRHGRWLAPRGGPLQYLDAPWHASPSMTTESKQAVPKLAIRLSTKRVARPPQTTLCSNSPGHLAVGVAFAALAWLLSRYLFTTTRRSERRQ